MTLLGQRNGLRPHDVPAGPRLEDGARVGIVGGGPAGSFFAYFVLRLAETVGRRLEVDVYEPRDFNAPAPLGCNMCGGIVSESLVQLLAAEGIDLPPSVIQRGIDSYVLHMDVGTVRIDTPLHEMRIGAVHRGGGPRDIKQVKWESFDAYLQSIAAGAGARVVKGKVEGLAIEDGRPVLTTRDGSRAAYDLVVVAVGVNSGALKLFEGRGLGYAPPRTAKTFIREYFLGEDEVERVLGNSMHVFLLNIPGLEFAAIIPKGDYATVCLLGDDIDSARVDAFMDAPEVRACFPPELRGGGKSCQCSPRINVEGSPRPFADRILFLGDSGVTRLYKDGIGAAYRTAKVAATTAVFEGVSAASFERYFMPACRTIRNDNRIGKLAFGVSGLLQRFRFTRRGLLRMTAGEQARGGETRRMSRLLWDIFTGSAPYRSALARTATPAFVGRLVWDTVAANLAPGGPRKEKAES